MKTIFIFLLLVPFLGFSGELSDIRFESNGWTLSSGASWNGITGELTIVGDPNSYRNARITINIPPGTTDLYLSGEVYFSNIINGSNAWERPKLKILYPNSNTSIKACNFNGPAENQWYSTFCHASNFNSLNLTQVTLEFGMQNTSGTFKARVPKITDTEPVVSPYSFPYPTPPNAICQIDILESEKEAFNNDLLSSNSHFSFNWPTASWSNTMVVNVIDSIFPMTNYRFPGGTVGNFYNWTTDGYHNSSSTFAAPFRQNLYNDGFKFDYSGFKNQVIKSGGSATLMFNVIHDDVNTAAARLQSRINDGIDVKWIELGNENYFPTQAYGYISGGWETPDADAYISHTKLLSSSLKSVKPNVKIAVNINHLTYATGDWSEKLSKESYYDATVLHNYISPRADSLNFNSGSEILRSYAVTKKNMTEYKKYFGSVPMIVTEWGIQGAPSSFLSVIASADIFMALLDEGFSNGVVKQAGIHMLYHSDKNQHQTMFYIENGGIRYTPTGVFFSKLFETFKNSSIYKAGSTSDMLETDLPSVNARALDYGDSIKIFAVNKLPVASKLRLTLDGLALANSYRKEVFAMDILSGWPNSFSNTVNPWNKTAGSGNASIPAYSITVVTMAKQGVVTSSTKKADSIREIRLFPNPVNQTLFVKGINEGEIFTVIDVQGKILLQGKYEKSGIETRGLNSGTYLLKLENQVLKFQKN